MSIETRVAKLEDRIATGNRAGHILFGPDGCRNAEIDAQWEADKAAFRAIERGPNDIAIVVEYIEGLGSESSKKSC